MTVLWRLIGRFKFKSEKAAHWIGEDRAGDDASSKCKNTSNNFQESGKGKVSYESSLHKCILHDWRRLNQVHHLIVSLLLHKA